MALSAQHMVFGVGRFLGFALVLLAAEGCRKLQPLPTASEPHSFHKRNERVRGNSLLEAFSLPHSEVSARLGPHRYEMQTRWSILPLPSHQKTQIPPVQQGFRVDSPAQPFAGDDAMETVPVTLAETRFIEVDSAGRIHLGCETDHDSGFEAFSDPPFVFSRMKHQPVFRYRDENSHADRLRVIAFDTGVALLSAVSHRLKLGMPESGASQNRAAWQVTLALADSEIALPPIQDVSQLRAASIDQISGVATVDREKGVPLGLTLSVRFVAPRPGLPDEQVRVEATHTLQVVALGKDAVHFVVPTDFSAPPTRVRPQLDRQELLSGLLPAFR